MRTSRGSRSYRPLRRVRPLPTRPLRLEVLERRYCLALTVPAFSSLPGANHTIFLDFDGHTTQNTAWNKLWSNSNIVSPAYNMDGNANNFGPQELAIIESAWKRVAEDYIPFQVNVTTVDPGVEALRRSGSADTKWGIRVVITADTEHTGAGGIGYVGSFNWNSDTPVFVYTTGEKSIAEAASHEVGHSLGLAHDGNTGSEYYSGHGTGETSWAPLMGVGYYKNVTTWSRGEYRRANNNTSSANYGKGADDLAIITGTNGFTYRGDDFGNETLTAGTLAGPVVNASGIISTTTDVDVFRIQAGIGTAALTISPFTPGPNLDVKAELINSQGVTIAVSDPPSVLTATINFNISVAGTYFLRVSGVGTGNPLASSPTGYTDYGSLGRYFVRGTFVAGGTSGGGGGTSPGPVSPAKKSASSQSSPGIAGGETTFSGYINPGWNGWGDPPKPELDPWSDFAAPDGDFPREEFFDAVVRGDADSHAAAIILWSPSSRQDSFASGHEPSAPLPMSLLGGSLRRFNSILEDLPAAEAGTRGNVVFNSSRQRDEIFDDNSIDWTPRNSRLATATIRLSQQLTVVASAKGSH